MQIRLSAKLKRALKPLEKTVLHPQWLSYRQEDILIEWLKTYGSVDTALDIGCADRWPEKYVSHNCKYIGLDYFDTATKRYGSVVDIYASAEALPFSNETIDVVILFDVLEHIADADTALQEMSRVLKPGGRALMQVPFMYPIHDAPHDYRRPTRVGIEVLSARHGFTIEIFGYRGKPLESAMLLTNIALTSTFLGFLEKYRFISSFLLPFLGVGIVLLNCIGWFASIVFAKNELMPFSYHFVLKKNP